MLMGERIRELRRTRKISGRALAKQLGISHVFLHVIEHGHADHTSGPYLEKLADALHTSVDYLLNRTDDPVFIPVRTQKASTV